MTIGVPFARRLGSDLPVEELKGYRTASVFRRIKAAIQGIYDELDYLRGVASGQAEYLDTPTLTKSGVTAGTYGTLTSVPVLTIDAQGLVTSATTIQVRDTGLFGNGALTTFPITSALTAFNRFAVTIEDVATGQAEDAVITFPGGLGQFTIDYGGAVPAANSKRWYAIGLAHV